MSLVFTNKRQLVPQGVIQGVLAEIYDRGMVETPWGEQHKVRFVYEVTELRNGTNTPLTVAVDFKCSWNPRSNLWKHVEAILGRNLTSAEQGSFNPDNLIGINALLTIRHNESNGNTYANVVSATPLMGTMKPIEVSEHYVPAAVLEAERAERLAASGGSSYVV